MSQKLYGSLEDLQHTATFVVKSGETIWWMRKKKKKYNQYMYWKNEKPLPNMQPTCLNWLGTLRALILFFFLIIKLKVVSLNLK